MQWLAQLNQVTKPLSPLIPTMSISTDASLRGWGATWGNQFLSSKWDTQSTEHINVLELKAILLAIRRWAPPPLQPSSGPVWRQQNSIGLHPVGRVHPVRASDGSHLPLTFPGRQMGNHASPLLLPRHRQCGDGRTLTSQGGASLVHCPDLAMEIFQQ